MFSRRDKSKSRRLRIRKFKKPKRKLIFGKKVKMGFYGVVVGAAVFGILRFLRSGFFTPLSINVSIHQCREYACLVEGNVKTEIEELFVGKNLIFTDFGKLANQFRDQNLVIAEVKVDRLFLFRKLEIEVLGRRALAVVREAGGLTLEVGNDAGSWRLEDKNMDEEATSSASKVVVDSGASEGSGSLLGSRSSKYYFVDEEGMVFAEAENTFGLPIVPLSKGQAIEVGDRVEGNQINTYLEILKFLDKNKIAIQNIEVGSDDQVLIYVSHGPKVIFSAQKDTEKQISLLAVILQRYYVEGKKLKRVDLRFDKPVVEY